MLTKRLLHAFPEAPELAARYIIPGNTGIGDSAVLSKPELQVLGLGSMLQARLPASSELIARRNALVGVLGAAMQSRSSSALIDDLAPTGETSQDDVKIPATVKTGTADLITTRLSLAKRAFTSLMIGQPVLHQKIVGASSVTCLLSSKNQVWNTVHLDGTVDWVVRSPVAACVGQQLRVEPRLGWSPRAAAPFGHSLVSGRGTMALTTPGPAVQLTIPAGESVMVPKKHLSAFTVDSNSTDSVPKIKHLSYKFPALNPAAELPATFTVEPKSLSDLRRWLDWHHYKNLLSKWFHKLSKQATWLRKIGNTGQFVQISGPSVVLVSSTVQSVKRYDS